LTINVTIGLNGPTTAALHAAGQTVATPLMVRALLDTGSDVTCVASRVLRHLGLTPTEQRPAETVAGAAVVNLYDVNFSTVVTDRKRGPLLLLPRLRVMEMASALPGDIEVLIGLDVLAQCLTILDGPQRNFTLAD
jgi:hypothetical protein